MNGSERAAARAHCRFGMFMGPFHATNLDPTFALERDLQLVTLLDRLGFDEAWIGEHHSGGFEIIAAPEVFIAAAAERTKHIRLGTGVKSLPFHHPFIVAETLAQLDHMTRGRVMFGAGPGALPSDAKMFGLAPVDQRPRMDEALDCIVALLRGETVTKKTNWFELNEARLSVGCYSKPTMDIAVTAIRSPGGALAAGRRGAGLLVISGVDNASLKHHVANWKIYEETCSRHGHTADRSRWQFAIQMHIAESREQARKDMEYGLEKWIGYANDIVPAPNPPPRGLADPAGWMVANERQLAGNAAEPRTDSRGSAAEAQPQQSLAAGELRPQRAHPGGQSRAGASGRRGGASALCGGKDARLAARPRPSALSPSVRPSGKPVSTRPPRPAAPRAGRI